MKFKGMTCLAFPSPSNNSSLIIASQIRWPLKKSFLPLYATSETEFNSNTQYFFSSKFNSTREVPKWTSTYNDLETSQKSSKGGYLGLKFGVPRERCTITIPYLHSVPIIEIWRRWATSKLILAWWSNNIKMLLRTRHVYKPGNQPTLLKKTQ